MAAHFISDRCHYLVKNKQTDERDRREVNANRYTKTAPATGRDARAQMHRTWFLKRDSDILSARDEEDNS
ncbi:hypothetical protein EVAR_37520_1 [Eumeta japonica]|uniref:Uncharacterized protein n=1 Tax=Eumeta variegata TaxID=151549 RepID=A0A4C1XDI2_EUMVA|nr:hypothetical protein EVAR_37520_1 [Eumeta japonica]